MAQTIKDRRRIKISATVDADLLQAVDAFVDTHDGSNRSQVIDEALHLWQKRELDRAMEAQCLAPQSEQEREERAAWRHIQQAATQALFRTWNDTDPLPTERDSQR